MTDIQNFEFYTMEHYSGYLVLRLTGLLELQCRLNEISLTALIIFRLQIDLQ